MTSFLDRLREANLRRQTEWTGNTPVSNTWRAMELGGEVGEVLNEVKKLEREAAGFAGSRTTVAKLGQELGDVLICLDLLAIRYGIDLEAVTTDKFNLTSEKVGLETRL